MRKNILFFILVLVLSLVTAPYFGSWYDGLYPQSGDWIYDKEDAIFFAGMLLSYVFLIPFIFEIFGSGNRKKWVLWSLLPIFLFLMYGGINFIYLPIVLSLIGFAFAWLIRKIFIRHPNPPMVIK